MYSQEACATPYCKNAFRGGNRDSRDGVTFFPKAGIEVYDVVFLSGVSSSISAYCNTRFALKPK